MLCDTSTQHPQARAGRCSHAICGQRQVRKPPKMTNAVKAKWRMTRLSASSDQIIGVAPDEALQTINGLGVACASGGDHTCSEHPSHAIEGFLEGLQTAGERKTHVTWCTETGPGNYRNTGFIEQHLGELTVIAAAK
jgi:hypothetical protein